MTSFHPKKPGFLTVLAEALSTKPIYCTKLAGSRQYDEGRVLLRGYR